MKTTLLVLCAALTVVVLVTVLGVNAKGVNPSSAGVTDQPLQVGETSGVSVDQLSIDRDRGHLPTEVGDANGDGLIDGDDCGYIIEYLLYGGPPPVPLESADVNCDGVVTIADAVGLGSAIAANGPPPGDPNGDGVPDC